MKTRRPANSPLGALLTALAAATIPACRASPAPVEEPAPTPAPAATASSTAATAMTAAEAATGTASGAYVVDVIAEDYAFQAPDEIPSGWITFRLRNEGEETHFIYLTKLAGGHTYDEYVSDVGGPIAALMDRQRAGELTKAEVGQQLGAEIPGWYWTEASPRGGPGMVAPGGVSQATVQLEPGLYVMECFMKTPEGQLHWVEGMIRPITVTDEDAGAPAPEADLRMTLRADEFVVDGEVTPGVHTVALTFEEHPEVGFGNDVHLARLDEGLAATDLLPWMDFMNPEGLENPAPAVFLGGAQERPAGHTLYFTVALEPGRYAWVSEGPDVRRMVQEFEVPR